MWAKISERAPDALKGTKLKNVAPECRSRQVRDDLAIHRSHANVLANVNERGAYLISIEAKNRLLPMSLQPTFGDEQIIKIIASAAALALLSGSAFVSTISGSVRSYDKNVRVIVLEDGSTASIPPHVGIPVDLDAGSQATILFNDDTGRPTAVFSDSLLGR